MQRKNGIHFRCHFIRHAFFGAQREVFPIGTQRFLAALDCGAKRLHRQRLAQQGRNFLCDFPQLSGQFLDRLGRAGEGHIEYKVRHIVKFGQAAECQRIRVAGETRIVNKARPRQNARVSRPKNNLVVRAERFRYAGIFRRFDKASLGARAGEIAGKPFREHRGEIKCLQKFARRK